MTVVVVGRRGRRPAGSGVPLTFEVIAETLRERIRSGGLRPGDLLPTQAVLMREFNVSGGRIWRGRVIAVGGLVGDRGGATEGVAEAVDGVALEAESDVGVDLGGDGDAGVVGEFPDCDEVDAFCSSIARTGCG